MQKKAAPESSGQNWEGSLKKQQRSEMMRKVMIWGGIILACIAGMIVLVKLAGNSGSSPTEAPKENPKVKVVSSKEIVMGNKEAKIELIEYADFQCPSCAAYNPIVKKVLSDYDGKVKVAYRFFPLRGIHQNALISGQAGYAAWKMGNFPEMKDLLFENQKKWSLMKESDAKETFISYGQQIGLNKDEFATLMNSEEAKKAVLDGEAEALGLGLNSTPSFFINKKYFSPTGPETFKELIDEELKKLGEKAATPTTKPLQ